jgi:hypothetical protein
MLDIRQKAIKPVKDLAKKSFWNKCLEKTKGTKMNTFFIH